MADVKLDIGLAIQANNKVLADVTKALDGLNKSLGETESATKKAGDSTNQLGNIFKGAFFADLASSAIKGLSASITQFALDTVKQGISAATEFEDAMTRFNSALAASGIYTRSASKEFEIFANTIESKTGIADDAIVNIGATLANLVNTSVPNLKLLTEGVINLSVRFGVDLETAARKVAQAIDSGGDGLKRYGINVAGATTEAQRLQLVIDQLANSQGAAEARTRTFSGAINQTQTAYNNILQTIGELFTKNLSLIGVFNSLSKELVTLEAYIKSNSEAIKTGISVSISVAIELLLLLVNTVQFFERTWSANWYAVLTVINSAVNVIASLFSVVITLVAAVVEAFFGAKNAVVDFQKAVVNFAQGSIDQTKEFAEKAKDNVLGFAEVLTPVESALNRMGNAAAVNYNLVKSGAEASVEPINQNKAAIDSLNASLERQKQLEEEKKKLIQEGEQVFQRTQNQDPNAKYEAELAALDAYHTAKLERERGHQEQIDAINAEFDAARAVLQEEKDIALADKKQKELDDLVARNEILRQLDEQKNATEIAANQAKIDAILKSEQTSQKTKDKYRLDEQKKNQQALNERFAQAQQFFNGLAALQETGSRTLFNIGKKAAIAEATVSGVQAVQNALAVKPTPVGIALAAAMAIRTAVNIQKIQAQQFQAGTDFVRGPGGIDNVPALLTRGERVISREGNEDLTQFLQDQGPQNEILLEISSKLDRLSPNVTVEIGGKEIANVVREQVRAGRVIA